MGTRQVEPPVDLIVAQRKPFRNSLTGWSGIPNKISNKVINNNAFSGWVTVNIDDGIRIVHLRENK